MKLAHLVVIVVAALAGCASQASADYQGEPLLSLNGTVVNQLSVTPARAAVILDFLLVDGTAPSTYWMSVPTSGEFPSAFTLDVYAPPPPSLAFRFLDGSDFVSLAGVYVVQLDDSGRPIATLGQLANRSLLYVSDAVAADSPLGSVYGALTSGYHLFERDMPAPTAAEVAQCTSDITTGSCSTADAAAYCAVEAASFETTTFSESELPPSTDLSITLDGLPCGLWSVP